MQIFLNGESQNLSESTSLSDLVLQLDLAPSRIAIELNRTVVRRTDWPAVVIKEGDRIEIVHFVGGGDRV